MNRRVEERQTLKYEKVDSAADVILARFSHVHRGVGVPENDSCGRLFGVLRHHPPAAAPATAEIVDAGRVQKIT
jgi:hypothetical protein